MERKNCWNRYILPFIQIFLFITTLYFGWTYYMTSQINKNEATKIISEKYSPMIESLPEKQKSHLSTEMPETFFKPEVIDKTNKVSEDMKDQDLIHKITVANVPSMMQTNIQNTSNVRSENIIRTNANGNRPLVILSSGNLEHDEKFTESSMSKNIFSIKSIDKNVSIDKNDKSDHPTQFLEKLQHISKIKATNDLEKIKNKNNFSDVDRLMLKSQDHALGASNKSESLEFNATNSNFKNFDNHTNNANQTINTSVIEDILDKLSDIAGGGAEIIEPFMGASQASNENNDQFNQISWKEIEKEAEEAKAEEERANAELEKMKAEEETIKEAEKIAKAVEGAIQDFGSHYEHYDVHGNKVTDENSIISEGHKSPIEIEYKPEIIRLPEFHMPRLRGK